MEQLGDILSKQEIDILFEWALDSIKSLEPEQYPSIEEIQQSLPEKPQIISNIQLPDWKPKIQGSAGNVQMEELQLKSENISSQPQNQKTGMYGMRMAPYSLHHSGVQQRHLLVQQQQMQETKQGQQQIQSVPLEQPMDSQKQDTNSQINGQQQLQELQPQQLYQQAQSIQQQVAYMGVPTIQYIEQQESLKLQQNLSGLQQQPHSKSQEPMYFQPQIAYMGLSTNEYMTPIPYQQPSQKYQQLNKLPSYSIAFERYKNKLQAPPQPTLQIGKWEKMLAKANGSITPI